MDSKEPKTLEEQIEILCERGVSIESEEDYSKAEDIIKRVGYYKLINGYKKLFIKTSEDEATGTIEEYKEGTRLDEIFSLYTFDKSLREVMLRHILPVEIHIKSLLAFVISNNYGNDNYLKYQNFNNERSNAQKRITAVISDIYKQIANRNSDPSIHHYLTKYGFVPMWVLNNILTMGNISKLFSAMKISDRQEISREFNIQDNMLENFLHYLTNVRNLSAHGNRLYCMHSNKPLIDTPLHSSLGITKENEEYEYGKRDILGALISLKYLVSNNDSERLVDEINELLSKLSHKLHTISIDDVKNEMGLTENWWKLKRRNIL